MGILSEGVTQILIPLAALIGIGFALLQWILVSKVKISATSESDEEEKSYKSSLLADSEMEDGLQGLKVTIKCAEIQHAISVGELTHSLISTIYVLKIKT